MGLLYADGLNIFYFNHEEHEGHEEKSFMNFVSFVLFVMNTKFQVSGVSPVNEN